MIRLILAPLLMLASVPAGAKTFNLPATPTTVAWGHYDATSKPVLTIRSGDTVVVHTLLTNSPTGLFKAGVGPADIEPALKAVFDGVPQAEGRGQSVKVSDKYRPATCGRALPVKELPFAKREQMAEGRNVESGREWP